MLTVVCAKWGDSYRAEHVNRLADMVDAHLKRKHRFVCMTDRNQGIERRIECVTVAEDLIWLGKAYPKLAIWGRAYGERMLWLDLDITIKRNIDHLVDRDEPIVLLSEFDYVPKARPNVVRRRAFYNTSVMLLDHDAAPHVWTAFDPDKSPDAVRASGMIGSDQAWVSLMLGPDQSTFPDGEIASYRFDVLTGRAKDPAIVVHHGRPKPWDV